MEVFTQAQAYTLRAAYKVLEEVADIDSAVLDPAEKFGAGATKQALDQAKDALFEAVNVAHARAKCPKAIVLIDQLLLKVPA